MFAHYLLIKSAYLLKSSLKKRPPTKSSLKKRRLILKSPPTQKSTHLKIPILSTTALNKLIQTNNYKLTKVRIITFPPHHESQRSHTLLIPNLHTSFSQLTPRWRRPGKCMCFSDLESESEASPPATFY